MSNGFISYLACLMERGRRVGVTTHVIKSEKVKLAYGARSLIQADGTSSHSRARAD